MARIDYFFATISVYSYLAGQRLEAAAARHGATVRYCPVDPAGLFPRTGGQVLAERHPARRAYRLQDIVRLGRRLGLPVNPQPAHFPVNPAPSAYAIIAAARAGGGDLGGLVHGVMRALWAEERDIADDGVLGDLLMAHGFDRGLADRDMLAAAETYAANADEAVARGVFGFPFYIVGEAMFWGQDRIEELERHLAGQA
jgi:2-hydroxychromene-2-carboxylate isomerase